MREVRKMSEAEKTLKNAVKQAGQVIAEYLQPGPRNCEETLDAIRAVPRPHRQTTAPMQISSA